MTRPLIYVDPLLPCAPTRRWPWSTSCHLFGEDIEKLHVFAESIGLNRQWFQNRPNRLPHYDLTESKRRRAINAGAAQVSGRDVIKAYAKCGDRVAMKMVERWANGGVNG